MSLTKGTAPFSGTPAGRFNVAIEPSTGSVLFWNPVPQRIRGVFAGETVVDSERAHLLHETGHIPVYYFPEEDVRGDLLDPSETHTHCPHKGEASYRTLRVGDRTAVDALWTYPEPIEDADFLHGHVAFYWSELDAWYADDERLIVHARDPFTRIDVYPVSRRLRVLRDGEVLADSDRALALYETGLVTRYYVPREDVRLKLVEESDSHTGCAYKGFASYYHVRVGQRLHKDLAWYYPEPQHDAVRVRDMIAFWNERVDIELGPA
jgi:uncharacterized protein (DUF427 family)